MATKRQSGGRKSSSYSKRGRDTVSRHVRRHRKKGMPQRQAVAAAMSEARRKGRKVPSRRRARKGGGRKRTSSKRAMRKGR